MIPTIVRGTSFTTTCRPTAFGSPFRRSCQMRCDRTTRWFAPPLSSPGANARSSVGRTPNTSKKFDVTRAPHADSGLVSHGSAEDSVIESPRGHTLECAHVALVEHDAGVRLIHRRRARIADGMREAQEAVRFRERQWLEQNAVHEAEDGRRRADAEGQHKDDRREPKLRPGREHPSEVYLSPHLCFKQGRPPPAALPK
jgi:hypothetical protein